jgi:hypothetical protein
MRTLALLTVSLLALLLPRPALAADRLVTVAMDARGFDDAAYKALGLLSLQRQLALRLTQTGFAVVGLHKAPQIRIVFRGAEGGLTVEVSTSPRSGSDITAQVARGRGDLETFHLDVIHQAMALVRQAAQALPPASQPSSAPSSQPASRPVAPPVRLPVEPRPKPASWGLELAGGTMALYRPGGVDLLLRGSGRLGLYRGLGLRGAVSISPYLGSATLTVVELGFQAGASWRFQLTKRLHLEPGLLAGVLQHIYDGKDTADNGSELTWDFLGSLSVELGLRLHRYLGLRLWLAPGFTIQQSDHTDWSRGAFRLEVGAVGVLILR